MSAHAASNIDLPAPIDEQTEIQHLELDVLSLVGGGEGIVVM